jgi:hypothetical protein
MPEINVATLNAQARQAYDGEEFLEAAELFCQAAELLQNDQPLEAGEALNNASVAYLRANKPQEALEKASGTEKLFHDAGDTRREAMAYGNLAAPPTRNKKIPFKRWRITRPLLSCLKTSARRIYVHMFWNAFRPFNETGKTNRGFDHHGVSHRFKIPFILQRPPAAPPDSHCAQFTWPKVAC